LIDFSVAALAIDLDPWHPAFQDPRRCPVIKFLAGTCFKSVDQVLPVGIIERMPLQKMANSVTKRFFTELEAEGMNDGRRFLVDDCAISRLRVPQVWNILMEWGRSE
jgi:hypothetical protein